VSSSGFAAPSWRERAERDGRRLAAASTAGAVAGLLVGGGGGRLAMMLLAVRNPAATGLTSDDGFRIGQFTVAGTLNLFLATTLIGTFGGGAYLVLREFAIGPPWFRRLSLTAGPAVVVGSLLVHPDGVDFTALQPAWLAIALFVAIPFAYAVVLVGSGERLLGSFSRAPRAALLVLLPWVVFFPLGAGLVVAWLVVRVRWIAWPVRFLLAVVFVFALVDMVRDIEALT
jgi:hypothetical protein